jgi:hypothetical protein
VHRTSPRHGAQRTEPLPAHWDRSC